MKKLISLLLCAAFAFSVVGCGARAGQESSRPQSVPDSQPASQAQPVTMRIAGLKGPTTMGMVRLMKDAEMGTARHAYQVTMYGTADEVIPLLKKGELDMAALPSNLAANLYQKLDGSVQAAAVNTLGVLYLVSTGDSVKTIQDLAGRTVYSPGKGTTPEYVMNYLLQKNGLDPAKDLTIEYRSEATEVLELLKTAGPDAVAVLPQPYVTAAMMQMEGLHIVLDLQQEWKKADLDSDIVTGVLLVRREFVQQHPEAFQEFLQDYKHSSEWVNENPAEAAQLIEKYGVVAKAAIAEKALPYCNIVHIEGSEMHQRLSGYLKVLYDQQPKAVGGTLPDDEFYYGYVAEN